MNVLNRFLNKNYLKNIYYSTSRSLSNKNAKILGIETSCDDTGCAIVDSQGNILGEAINSQLLIHLRHGGIIPPIAQDLHRNNIERVVQDAVASSKLTFDEISAIAVTVKPGLPLSLEIGMKYGKYLCRKYDKPFIPIHHMKAHALTARMHDRSLKFPFLVLLISGGHCLLAVAKNVNDFVLLGQTINDAPGEAYDKMARRLKLTNIPEFSNISSGQAIEIAASRADDPFKFPFTVPLLHYRNCNFSFTGIKNQMKKYIEREEKLHDLPPDAVIPSLYNLCAGFQFVITQHLCHRVQRAIEYVNETNMVPLNNRVLVVSGGVACNNFIAKGLKIICDELNYKIIRPPPKLCTDNGVMIAWNGMEKWIINDGLVTNLETITVANTCPLGENIIKEVTLAAIKPKWIKLKSIFDETTHRLEVNC